MWSYAITLTLFLLGYNIGKYSIIKRLENERNERIKSYHSTIYN